MTRLKSNPPGKKTPKILSTLISIFLIFYWLFWFISIGLMIAGLVELNKLIITAVIFLFTKFGITGIILGILVFSFFFIPFFFAYQVINLIHSILFNLPPLSKKYKNYLKAPVYLLSFLSIKLFLNYNPEFDSIFQQFDNFTNRFLEDANITKTTLFIINLIILTLLALLSDKIFAKMKKLFHRKQTKKINVKA